MDKAFSHFNKFVNYYVYATKKPQKGHIPIDNHNIIQSVIISIKIPSSIIYLNKITTKYSYLSTFSIIFLISTPKEYLIDRSTTKNSHEALITHTDGIMRTTYDNANDVLSHYITNKIHRNNVYVLNGNESKKSEILLTSSTATTT